MTLWVQKVQLRSRALPNHQLWNIARNEQSAAPYSNSIETNFLYIKLAVVTRVSVDNNGSSTSPVQSYRGWKRTATPMEFKRPFTSSNIPSCRAPHAPVTLQTYQPYHIPQRSHQWPSSGNRKKARAKDRDKRPTPRPSRQILGKAGIFYLPQTDDLNSALCRFYHVETLFSSIIR